MSNPAGHPATLQAGNPGNVGGYKHGLFAARRSPLSPDGEQMVEELLALPHIVAPDVVAIRELVSLLELAARVDEALASGNLENRRGAPRALIEHRRRLSAEIARWTDRLGLSPQARYNLAAVGASSALASEIARRRAENTA